MGRPKGSRNKVKRNRARTPYETYVYWYDKYTKNGKDKLFMPKFNKQEFEFWYRRAKVKNMSNPARRVAMDQEYVERSMEKGLRKMYGKDDMPDLSTKEARQKMAQDYVDQLVLEGLSVTDAWEEFREYFY